MTSHFVLLKTKATFIKPTTWTRYIAFCPENIRLDRRVTNVKLSHSHYFSHCFNHMWTRTVENCFVWIFISSCGFESWLCMTEVNRCS